MTTFESAVKTIASNRQSVYETLSDLRNLEQSKHLVPSGSVQDIEFHEDKCYFSVNPIGRIELSVVEKEPFGLVKLGSQSAPVDFHVSILLQEAAAMQTALQVRVEAEIPSMIKIMFGGKMQQFVDQFADTLASVKYR
jgi:carbon monoxide dehydrogenase subunit G